MPFTRALIPVAALLLIAVPARGVEWTVLLASPAASAASAGVREFAQNVTGATAGALTLRPGDAAGPGTDTVAMVSAGRAAAAVIPLAILEAADPVLAMDRVPYLATNFIDAGKLWQVLRPRVERTLSARGMALLYAIPAPPPAPLSRRPLESLEAWRGSRLLVDAPALVPLARFLGASAVAAAPAREVLAGERADVVFRSASAAARDRAWEYASHYVHAPGWFPKYLVVVSRQSLAALGRGTRDALLSAADAAGPRAWAQAQADTVDGVQRLRDHGIRAVSAPVDLLIQLEALGRELLFVWSETAGEAGAEIVERYYAIR